MPDDIVVGLLRSGNDRWIGFGAIGGGGFFGLGCGASALDFVSPEFGIFHGFRCGIAGIEGIDDTGGKAGELIKENAAAVFGIVHDDLCITDIIMNAI